MKKFLKILLILILLTVVILIFNPTLRTNLLNYGNNLINKGTNGNLVLTPAKTKNYEQVQTKIAGKKNFPVYHGVSNNGPVNSFTSTRDFHYALLQSQESAQTKKGRYWKLAVDGREIGWISQGYFARNQIAVAKKISLVRNPNDAFNPRDAISYATNKEGTLINPLQVEVSINKISSANPGHFLVKYHYEHAKARTTVTVRPNLNEGVAVANKTAQAGPKESYAFTGSSLKSSPHWNMANYYQPETKVSTYRGSHHSLLKTRLFQPRFHLLNSEQENSQLNQVGVVPEGISLKNNYLTVSMFTNGNTSHGHLVVYNLKHLKDPLKAQNLLTMNWSDFQKYVSNIKISPYLKLGHGQAIGASKNHIYVLANSDTVNNGPQSDEVLELSKQNLNIEKIWTFKLWNRSSYFPRYLHNAYFANGHTIYALFHNGLKNSYEYWRIRRQGDTWLPTEIASTQGNFVSTASPAQGFAYHNHHFYLAFNDNLFIVNENGNFNKHYHFHTLRESEGIAVDHHQIYMELAHRAELLHLIR